MRSVNLGSYNKDEGVKVGTPNLDRRRSSGDKPNVFEPNTKESKKPSKTRRRFFKIFFLLVGVGITLGVVFALDNNVLRSTASNSLASENSTLIKEETCSNILNPKCWTESFKPELDQVDGYTNALIIGLDTRSEGNSGLKNTDSIMVASYNHIDNQLMFVSVPRDFYTPNYGSRINAVYALTSDRDPEDEFKYLREEVEEITGLPIQYQAVVRFDAVINGINELGGLEVCIDEAFRAKYPNDDAKFNGGAQWLFYDFEEGCQALDGEKALVYARFRYLSNGPSSLASDFSRARRQQEIIEALINKAVGEDISLTDRANNYWNLFNTYKKSVETNIGFQDVLAGVNLIDKIPDDQINVVLDPNFGGINNYIYTDTSSGAYLIKPKDPTYTTLQNKIAEIWEAPDIYMENPRILVLNQTGETYLPQGHETLLLENDIKYADFYGFKDESTKVDFAGIKIFDFSNGEKAGTLDYLKDYLVVDTIDDASIYGYTQSFNDEDILIVVGPEFLPTEIIEPTTEIIN